MSDNPTFGKAKGHIKLSYREHNKKCDTDDEKCVETKHRILLQLSDSLGFPVPGTEFSVTLDIIKERCKNKSKVTIQLPAINFETGQVANDPIEQPFLPPRVPGGYIDTAKCFLPKKFRPTDLLPQSIVAASNNGVSPIYSLTQLTFPTPPTGYIVQITNAGALKIQGVGTFGNIIPPGPQVLLPTTITYFVKRREKLCENFKLSKGVTDITGFTPPSAGDGFRDSHLNDAFNRIVAWTWTDNSTVADKTNGTMNTFVVIGKLDKCGKLKLRAPVQLTNFPPNVMSWDTAVAINRSNPNNIVVSYGIIDFNTGLAPSARAVSFDGGITWPAPYEYISFIGSITGNILTVTQVLTGVLSVGLSIITGFAAFPDAGVTDGTVIAALGTGTGGVGTYIVNIIQNVPSSFLIASPTLNGAIPLQTSFADGFGDNRGVSSDKFGNIWYLTGNLLDQFGNVANQPTFWISTDSGVTYTLIFSFPITLPILDPTIQEWDYPQMCFGGDETGQYGVFSNIAFNDFVTGNTFPNTLFIPIIGFGNIDIPNIELAQLPGLTNSATDYSSITASSDGRVWTNGGDVDPYANLIPGFGYPVPFSYIYPRAIIFKSPGALDSNYSGPWNVGMANNIGFEYFSFNGTKGVAGVDSFPFGLYFGSPQSILFDEKRKALYLMYSAQVPDNSQNMRIFFVISRNNGQTWTLPIEINTKDHANRGYQSMALDEVTGNLVFGWYDGRHDPNDKTVEYFGAVIEDKVLDKLVRAIPKSDPRYVVPPATTPPLVTEVTTTTTKMNKTNEMVKKVFVSKINGRRAKSPSTKVNR